MKTKLTKILSMALVFVMVMCLVPPVEATAASRPHYPYAHNERYYPNKKSANTIPYAFGSYKVNYKVTGIKSTNKKVATMTKTYKNNFTYLNLELKKEGSTTITFNVNIAGRTEKYTTRVTVKKYSPPLKTLKIGKTNFSSKIKNVEHYNIGGKTIKGKLNIKLNKNWEIISVNFTNAQGKMKGIKSNANITMKEKCYLFVNCRNKKTGVRETVMLRNLK